MDFSTYENRAAFLNLNLAMYSTDGLPIYYCLGLAGECGEFVDKIKKVWRNGTALNYTDCMKELGDVLWYLTMLARAIGGSLEHVATLNLEKLNNRKNLGTIIGEGDNR